VTTKGEAMETNELKALSETADELRVGNYIVLFGGRDLAAFRGVGDTVQARKNANGTAGEYFSEKTLLESEFTARGRLDVDWEHGDDVLPEDEVLGYVDWKTAKKDERGWFVERALNRQKKYVQWLGELIKAGLVGTSSLVVPGKSLKNADGEIIHWPLYKDTLTMTPAEPRMLTENTIAAMKALGLHLPDDTAQTAENGRTVSPNESDTDQPAVSNSKGLTDMEPMEIQKLVADGVAAAFKTHSEAAAAEAKSKADREQELKDAVAKERKLWDAEQKSMRRGGYAAGKAPAVISGQKDDWHNAFKNWIQTGERSGLDEASFSEETVGERKGLESYTLMPTEAEGKASNATDMNIGTAADGGDTVPTGFYNQIIARRDETLLRDRLGCRLIIGQGTSVDVPYDNEADGEFVTKAEATAFDLDAPALAKATMTLVNYTKYTDVSYQLLDDSAANIEAFLADFVGRGMAKTHNSLLLTEVAANGTSLKSFASATAIAAGEPEGIVSNNDLAAYLDEDNAVGFVMRASTHWAIKALTGNPRLYGSDQGMDGKALLGYRVLWSQKAAAPAASAKSVYFGNWHYVGYRESPGLTFIRDPYTVAINAQVRLLWHFRTVYKVLIAEAIGYAVHPSA
jgi:HK97 family phage major capsid protein